MHAPLRLAAANLFDLLLAWVGKALLTLVALPFVIATAWRRRVRRGDRRGRTSKALVTHA